VIVERVTGSGKNERVEESEDCGTGWKMLDADIEIWQEKGRILILDLTNLPPGEDHDPVVAFLEAS
jgi:hypothetical protein